MIEWPNPKCDELAKWDVAYREGTPPWDADKPHAELPRVLDEYRLRPRSVLEIGCGSGADACLLARRRFEVTAVDCSPIAIERARLRAERQDALLRFVQEDIFEFAPTAGQFDFVYDAGLYHSIRRTNLDAYLDMLWRVTQPGSYCLCLVGAPAPPDENGPAQVTADEIHSELGRLFQFVHLRPAELEGANGSYPAWSCLMHRPTTDGR